MGATSFSYKSRDLSNSARAGLSFFSRVVPIGTCVHTTFGVDSAPWLLGGSATAGQPASADYLIARDGARIKICPEGRRPYHVGVGQFVITNSIRRGQELSEMLMGVELECAQNEQCTFAQHDSLAELVVLKGIDYGWRWPYYLVGHYELARPYGRRSDPHGFEWGTFMGRLYARALPAGVPGL